MYCEDKPAAVTAIVPELVIGLLATLNAGGIVKPTEVTVPTPAPPTKATVPLASGKV